MTLLPKNICKARFKARIHVHLPAAGACLMEQVRPKGRDHSAHTGRPDHDSNCRR